MIFSATPLAVYMTQAVPFETQEMVHPMDGAIGPFFDLYFLLIPIPVNKSLEAYLRSAGGLAAFGSDFSR